MAPRTHPEHEPSPGQGLKRGRLFRHHRRLAQRELHHAGPERHTAGGGRRQRQDHHGLETRPVPEQMVARPERVSAQLLGPTAGFDHPVDRVVTDIGAPARGRAHAGTVSWVKVGRMSPTGPGGLAGRTMGTRHRIRHLGKRSVTREVATAGPTATGGSTGSARPGGLVFARAD